MIVCSCKGINDTQIKKALAKCAGNINEALKSLGVGSDCGTCLLETLQAYKNQEQSYSSKPLLNQSKSE